MKLNISKIASNISKHRFGYDPKNPEEEKILEPYMPQVLKITQGDKGKAYNLIYSVGDQSKPNHLIDSAKYLITLVNRYLKVQAAFHGIKIEADVYNPEDCWIDGFDDICVHLEENGAQIGWGDGYHRTIDDDSPLIPYNKLPTEMKKAQEEANKAYEAYAKEFPKSFPDSSEGPQSPEEEKTVLEDFGMVVRFYGGDDIDVCQAKFLNTPTAADFKKAKDIIRTYGRSNLNWYGNPVEEQDGWWSLGDCNPK
jgi:hypothetical protein